LYWDYVKSGDGEQLKKNWLHTFPQSFNEIGDSLYVSAWSIVKSCSYERSWESNDYGQESVHL